MPTTTPTQISPLASRPTGPARPKIPPRATGPDPVVRLPVEEAPTSGGLPIGSLAPINPLNASQLLFSFWKLFLPTTVLQASISLIEQQISMQRRFFQELASSLKTTVVTAAADEPQTTAGRS